MENKEKKFNIIVLVITSMLLLSFNVLIGSHIKYNCLILELITFILTVAVVLVKKIYFKNMHMIKSKMDIFVYIGLLVPIVPIIFKTTINFQDGFTYLFKYISILGMYLITRDLCENNEKFKKVLSNLILVSGMYYVVFGIDNMLGGFSSTLIKVLNLVDIQNIEQRMFGPFGYANTFAIFLAVAFIIAVFEHLHTKKNIYLIPAFMCIIGIVLSYSRGTIISLGIVLLLWLCLQENKEKRIDLILSCGITGILGLIYSVIFTRLYQQGNSTLIWILLIVFIGIQIGLTIIKQKWGKFFEKFTLKQYAILGSSIIGIFIIAILIGLNITNPLVINNLENDQEVKYKIYNVEPNTNYSLKFDIESYVSDSMNSSYYIRILEENEYLDEITRHEISFQNIDEIKDISFKTSDKTIELAVIIKAIDTYENDFVKINSLTVNDKERILKYAYLPVELVDRLYSLNLKTNVVMTRLQFYKDGMNLVKTSGIIGMGGNAWEDMQFVVQDFYYVASAVHNYPLQLLIEYGIIGILAYIGVLVILIINLITSFINKRNRNVMLIMCILLLVIHTLIDFDFSFMSIFLLLYILISQITYKNIKINSKINNVLVIVFVIIFTTCFGVRLIEKIHLSKMGKIKDVDTISKYANMTPYNEKIAETLSNRIYQNEEVLKKNIPLQLTTIKDMLEKHKYTTENIYYEIRMIECSLLLDDVNEINNNVIYIYNIINDYNISINMEKRLEQTIEIRKIADILLSDPRKEVQELSNMFINKMKADKEEIFELLESSRSRLNNNKKEMIAQRFILAYDGIEM